MTSNPSELDVVRALSAPDFPCWSAEAVVTLLAERFGCATRPLRPIMARIPLRLEISGVHLGRLDESWLFRLPKGGAPLADRLLGVNGVIAWDALDLHVIVRTWSGDAIEREKCLRDLHAKLTERPLAQLHRPTPARLSRKPTRADWALVAAMRADPWAPRDVLAKAANVSVRVAKGRIPRLVADRILVLDALPSEGLAHILVRVSPTSSAAAHHAFTAFDDVLLCRYVPEGDDASLVDALVVAPTPEMRKRALDVPGVTSVDIFPRRASWRDDATVAARIQQAMLSASS
jgi:hypothetical protein